MHSVQGFCLQLKIRFTRFHSRECILETRRDNDLSCTSAFVLNPIGTIYLFCYYEEHWDFYVYLELLRMAVYTFIIAQINTIIYRQVLISLFDSSRYLSWTVVLRSKVFPHFLFLQPADIRSAANHLDRKVTFSCSVSFFQMSTPVPAI